MIFRERCTSGMASAASCLSCGTELGDEVRFVLLVGRRHEEHCSESCLRQTIRQRRLARAAIGRRVSLWLALTASLLVGGKALWLRYRMPSPESISFDPPELRAVAPPSGPVELGPAWPPTDDDWMALFRQASWILPAARTGPPDTHGHRPAARPHASRRPPSVLSHRQSLRGRSRRRPLGRARLRRARRRRGSRAARGRR